MTSLDKFLKEGPARLAQENPGAVIALINALAKDQAPGLRGEYLWGAALLGKARESTDDKTIEKLAEDALVHFARVLQSHAEAERSDRFWIRLEPSVLAACHHAMAEAFRQLASIATRRRLISEGAGEAKAVRQFAEQAAGYLVQARKLYDAAMSIALQDLVAGLTKYWFVTRSGGVKPDIDPNSRITETEFSDATMPVVRELDAAHERAAKALQAIVTDEFSGREFASPQAQQHIIDRLRDLLMRLERRLECPVCHEPAMPKFTLGRTEGAAGHLQYRHSAADIRATHGGGSVFPQAKILPAPPGARRK